MDYRVKITIRNNRLLKAIEKKGYSSVRQFCLETGMTYQNVSEIISGKRKPLDEKGFLKSVVVEMLDKLDINQDEAFTERQLKGFKKRSFQIEMTETEALQIANPVKTAEVIAIESDVIKKLKEILIQKCSPRQQMAIQYYFFQNFTLEQVAEKMDFTRERARQLINKGLAQISKAKKELQDAGMYEAFPGLGDEFILEKNPNCVSSYRRKELN
jgi:DNA-directed RNA polymerase specialized sigma24 family protein